VVVKGLSALVAVLPAALALHSGAGAQPLRTCAPGYVPANLSWGERCLHAGQFCKVGNPEYRANGFACPATGRLVATSAAPGLAPPTYVGATVLLAPRMRTAGCVAGPEPDRRCSPGAYSRGLTAAVLCSAGFRTSAIRNVPQSEKYAVEREYGLRPGHYGRSLEIDHIVSLELGGSNDIANLFPERLYAHPGYRVKDRLENRLHDLVCSGRLVLRDAQHGIAADWEGFYERVFGTAPGG
jgi:hypothetical protein